MPNGVRLTGDWEGVRDTLMNLSSAIRKSGYETAVKGALYAEGQAKKHISAQDLGWYPLKPSTIAQKIRRGESTHILVASSTMFQAITSFNDGRRAYAGVKRTARTREGEPMHNVARTLEYGTRNDSTKARPLWRPVRKETKQFLKNSRVFQTILKRKLGI